MKKVFDFFAAFDYLLNMNENNMTFTDEANEMHAGAAEFVTQSERDEFNAWLDDVAGNVPDPQE